MKKEDIQALIEYVNSLPSGRKFFLNTGVLMVEVTKEEALHHLEKLLMEIEKEEGKNND